MNDDRDGVTVPSVDRSAVIKDSRTRLSALFKEFRASEPPAMAETGASKAVVVALEEEIGIVQVLESRESADRSPDQQSRDVDFLSLVKEDEADGKNLQNKELQSDMKCEAEDLNGQRCDKPLAESEPLDMDVEAGELGGTRETDEFNGQSCDKFPGGDKPLGMVVGAGDVDDQEPETVDVQGEEVGVDEQTFLMKKIPLQSEVEEGNIDTEAHTWCHMQDEATHDDGFTYSIPDGPEVNGETENRRSSLKRSRSCFDNTPCVQVTYKCLTSESKNKLKEFMRLWAEWHGRSVGQKEEADKDSLESGDEIYFPALQVGGQSNSTVSFWMDKPSKHVRTEDVTVECPPSSQHREEEVPLYDRAGTGALISQETEISLQGSMEFVEEGSRCFNCGSYTHSLKDCPRPRDIAAINNARKLLAEKKGSANGSRNGSRYYQSSPGGKFDGLKPGALGSETRQLLGIGEHDPPPWLHRMRELGYPPGYLEDQEDEPSGITIFGANESDPDINVGEDGEIVGGVVKKKGSSQKMTVDFPGVNAPIPDDADKRTWAAPADVSGMGPSGHRLSSRTNHMLHYAAASSVLESGRWGQSSDVPPPGTGHDSFSKSPKLWPSNESAGGYIKGSPRFPSEPGKSGIGHPTGSPRWGRSLSDSGRSPIYEEARPLPPLAGPHSGSKPIPFVHGQRSYQSPHTPSPTQRGPYSWEYAELEVRRRASAHAKDSLDTSHRSSRYHSRR